jgi:hypothetical protein
MGAGGLGGATDLPYYDTPAGPLRADIPLSSAYAGIAAREGVGMLYGDEKPGQPPQYLIGTQNYKKLQATAQKLTEDEAMARGGPSGLDKKDYSQIFHQHLYQLIYNFIQESAGPAGIDQLTNLGRRSGVEKTVKGIPQQQVTDDASVSQP